ncbi:hypothetical protein NDU88_007019 [Pleurodeles waltl]|uniref:Secreted protein n=1 Tax=Pleurodeles waltl TaxID=8319 RepID=A0AAV7MIZ3_PLEWA|nr:hypothetical protein NDU88_007019 [Pleurodeles waltl]
MGLTNLPNIWTGQALSVLLNLVHNAAAIAVPAFTWSTSHLEVTGALRRAIKGVLHCCPATHEAISTTAGRAQLHWKRRFYVTRAAYRRRH